jgi:microcompartment protein CcmK/EutM
VGAGTGEVVIIAQGSSSRQTEMTYQKPIDAVIAGIIDLVEENGKIIFRKQTDEHL